MKSLGQRAVAVERDATELLPSVCDDLERDLVPFGGGELEPHAGVGGERFEQSVQRQVSHVCRFGRRVSDPADGSAFADLPAAVGRAELRTRSGSDRGERHVERPASQPSLSHASPYARMSSISGTSARPFSVSAYSTRGGTSGNVLRSTTPSSSSARRRNESVRGLMPSSARSSSQKRDWPSTSSLIRSSVHFPQTISAVRQTGQVSARTSKR